MVYIAQTYIELFLDSLHTRDLRLNTHIKRLHIVPSIEGSHKVPKGQIILIMMSIKKHIERLCFVPKDYSDNSLENKSGSLILINGRYRVILN